MERKVRPPRAKAGTREAAERRSCFEEVSLGLTRAQALEEAGRCLACKSPKCVQGCPVGIDIPKFIGQVAQEDFAGALATIKEHNALPAVCGRVCPQETQCEALCVLGKASQPVAIGLLERFVADQAMATAPALAVAGPTTGDCPVVKSCSHKAAVIGSGPGGLTCAAELALMGHEVSLFESLHAAGGVLRYGIPEFRLPKAIVDREIDYIKGLGVSVEFNVAVGQTVTVDELRNEGYEAFFISTGAGLPYFLGVPGEALGGVYSANEFLTRVNLMKAYRFPDSDTPVRVGKHACIVGGGNVAMDAARTALRLGAETATIVYRRSMAEMPARHEEVEHAIEEGIHFECLANPVSIQGDGNGYASQITCIRMELGEVDASGRRSPVAVPGSEFTMPAETVVIAVGQGPNPVLTRNTPGLGLNRRGYIVVDATTGETSLPGVFAGGDIVTGAATVIEAMGSGKRAAKAMNAYLVAL